MFALTSLDSDFRINLKCDPEKAIQLRDRYDYVLPGWHMNKQQWNSVYYTGSISAELVIELIDHSYDLVVKSLKRADREALERQST